MIAIIDYGMGNLRSVQKGFERAGHKAVVTGSPEEILVADGVVLPGVGAFRDCMKNLTEGNLIDTIYKVVQEGKPFLGICLGLQLLFTESEEFGIHKGLDIIKGRVIRFSFSNSEPRTLNLKVPHMGWNNISIKKDLHLFEGIPDSSFFYFVHSYYVIPEDGNVIASTTDYGVEFVSGISKDNILAFQFHPEKSQEMGLRILKNFGDFCK
ncbi:MAG: imidazole glycerol phosphate synthase subunit HisH [Nitrospinota bacterium]